MVKDFFVITLTNFNNKTKYWLLVPRKKRVNEGFKLAFDIKTRTFFKKENELYFLNLTVFYLYISILNTEQM